MSKGGSKSGRNGQGTALLIMLLLAVVLLVVFAFLLPQIRGSTKELEQYAQCRTQVQSHVNALRFTQGVAKPEIKCPTIYVTTDARTDEEANSLIAEEMRLCWSTWGEGQEMLFTKTQTGVYCHVCSMVTVTGLNEIHGLPAYLGTRQANGDQTYSQYFTAQRGTYFENASVDTATTIFNTDKPIGVIFVQAKGMDTIGKIRNAIIPPPAAGAGIGAVVGGGLVVAGLGLTSTGVLSPVGIVVTTAGVTLGAGSGLAASLFGTKDADTLSLVVARPLTEEGVRDLGCEYAPVSQSGK